MRARQTCWGARNLRQIALAGEGEPERVAQIMDMLDGETEVRDYGLERLMMLSDGVFAIAMTLLALDLHPQGAWTHTVPGLLDAISGPFQTFFWSFFTVGIFWALHRRHFGNLRRADGVVSALNLLLLGEVVLVPAATRMLPELDDHGAAILLLLAVLGAIGVTMAAGNAYAMFVARLVRHRPGRASALLNLVLQILLPVAMPALGMFSAYPGLHWLLAVMPLVVLAARGLRRGAARIDSRRAAAR